MNSDEAGLHQAHLAFVGRIIAGVCHEFKNHLGVTKELSGLLDDLLAMENKAPSAERIAQITSGIEERITAAAEMANHLSRFAHRMDVPLSSFSVGEAVAEIVYLSRRFARLKNATLTMEPGPELPPLHSNPSLLQFVVFSVIMPMLDHLEKQGGVRLAVGTAGDRMQLVFQFEKIRGEMTAGQFPNPSPAALQALEAEYSFAQSAGTARATLLIASIPPRADDCSSP